MVWKPGKLANWVHNAALTLNQSPTLTINQSPTLSTSCSVAEVLAALLAIYFCLQNKNQRKGIFMQSEAHVVKL